MIEIFEKTFSLFVSPEQRLYWPVLLSSLIFAFIYTKGFNFFSKESLLHPSSIVDFKLLLLNNILKIFLFPIFFVSSFKISVFTHKFLYSLYPSFSGFEVGGYTKAIIATFMAFIINDFLRFFQHLLMHEIKFLRVIHSTHHSAQVLTPFTLFRTHPLESFLGACRSILSLGLVLAFYSFLFKGKVSAIDILGVNAFGFIFNAFLSNLRHSPIPISFGIFEYIFVSPRMHQIHHSRDKRHLNKNYGVALALWDQIWGTYYKPTNEECNSLVFGFNDNVKARTLLGALGIELNNKRKNRYEENFNSVSA